MKWLSLQRGDTCCDALARSDRSALYSAAQPSILSYSRRFCNSHRRGRQIFNRSPSRQKEIAAAACGDEAGQPCETDRAVMGRNAVARGAVAGAGQRIAFAREAMERGAVDPSLLQEF